MKLNDQITFTVADDAKKLGLRGAYFVVDFTSSKANPEAIAPLLHETIKKIRDQQIDVKADPILTGFRDLHTKAGVSNRKHISSPENLITLILGGRDLPSINPIVDIYNIVSLETRLALGAHDTSEITGPIALKLTEGTESFTPLGSNEQKAIGVGEYGYIDEGQNEVICRLETRQCEKTKVADNTQQCFFIVEGSTNTELSYIEDAVTRLQHLLSEHCGAGKINKILWLSQ
jgi:DNA/RNA-binding domain of Phe-tRNA-synthetase-like protein